MKLKLLFLATFTLASNMSLAKPVELSQEANDIIQGLISSSGQMKLPELQSYLDGIDSIERTEMNDLIEYRLHGKYSGGSDTPCGFATILIQKGFGPQFGFPDLMIPYYRVEIEKKENLCANRFIKGGNAK